MAEYLIERINSGFNQIQILGKHSHPCTNSLNELDNPGKELGSILDFIGRETSFQLNVPLIYLFSDGSVEKKFIVE